MTQINMEALTAAARIALTEEEKNNLAGDVAAILALGHVLAEADESDSGTLSHNDVPIGAPEAARATAALRADEPCEGLARDTLLALAPTARDGYVTVPRVIADAPKGGEDA